MIQLRVRNVEHALFRSLDEILPISDLAPTRNGDAHVAPEPVVTEYERPEERVIFNPHRDANPFFHLIEALWMLAGFDEVAVLDRYVPRMRDFSDDGVHLHGAYGRRWVRHWDIDQVSHAILGLKKKPGCRRSGSIAMFDPEIDIPMRQSGLDVPCNLTLHFQQDRRGRLDLTVMARSNDAILGAYGANAVHFSMLQSYVAQALGWPVGIYRQISLNWHCYDNYQTEQLRSEAHGYAHSETGLITRYEMPFGSHVMSGFPLFHDRRAFDAEIAEMMSRLLDDSELTKPWSPREPFIAIVAWPMAVAHAVYRERKQAGSTQAADNAIDQLGAFQATRIDWLVAAHEWLDRRRAYVPPLRIPPAVYAGQAKIFPDKETTQ